MSCSDDESSESAGFLRRLAWTEPTALLDIQMYGNDQAPKKGNNQKMVVKLTAGSSSESGKMPALDLAVVIDISGSMRGQKLDNLKKAMKYVIKKLGVDDRLTIIPFSTTVEEKPEELVAVSEAAKKKWASFVDGLVADGDTNISAGLQAGLKALRQRVQKDGRAAGIFLMTDGLQNRGGDARTLAGIDRATVHTFGFGDDHDHVVLEAIARKSHGGTYHNVWDDEADNLTMSFSQPLAGLRSVVMLALKLTLEKEESTIEKVDPGTYPQKRNANGSVTVDFGHLYRDETRTVLVFLCLPAGRHRPKSTVMTAQYEYCIPGEGKISDYKQYAMERTIAANLEYVEPEVRIELARRDHVSSIRKVKGAADCEQLHKARRMLDDALNALSPLKILTKVLEEEEYEEEEERDWAWAREMISFLTNELQLFRRLLVSQEMYNRRGPAYALASISSHDRQRFTARGTVHNVRLFATPRMDKYLRQAAWSRTIQRQRASDTATSST